MRRIMSFFPLSRALSGIDETVRVESRFRREQVPRFDQRRLSAGIKSTDGDALKATVGAI